MKAIGLGQRVANDEESKKATDSTEVIEHLIGTQMQVMEEISALREKQQAFETSIDGGKGPQEAVQLT